MKVALAISLSWLIVACSSARVADAPPWTRAPTRTVDSGYLVYVGRGESDSFERARFEAEGAAINDLANECTFAPKGARIEDRFEETSEHGIKRAYVKAGLLFEECEGAKKAVEPEDVQKLANVAMAETLKRYHDSLGAEPPPPDAINDAHDYVAARDHVVRLKQEVIVNASTFDREVYFTRVRPLYVGVETYEAAHPEVRAAPPPWSSYRHLRKSVPAPRNVIAPAHERPAPEKKPLRRRRRHRR